jgi:glycosyltransferase involved in cell wall biosynthesis
MSSPPTYCKVFEAVGDFSAIGRGAALDCRIMLDAGYKVTVVSKLIDSDLRKEVEWLPLTVPPRGFALQWLSARHFLLKARGKQPFDVVMAHQPQISDSCDIFQCHFLTRAAANRGVLTPFRGKRALIRIQEEIVLRAEDRFYKKLAHLKKRQDGMGAPHLLFISELMEREFHTLYGVPAKGEVLVKAPPTTQPPDTAARSKARQEWAPEAGNKLVVGFLGGTHERKGFRRVLRAMEQENELFLLFGGPNSESFTAPQLDGRFKSVGFVRDTASFYAACDVFLVVSPFEPLGMVAMEAAAHGVPVVASTGVGALPTLERFNAGIAWPDDAPLGEPVRAAASRRAQLSEGARELTETSGKAAYARRMLEVCDLVRAEKRGLEKKG